MTCTINISTLLNARRRRAVRDLRVQLAGVEVEGGDSRSVGLVFGQDQLSKPAREVIELLRLLLHSAGSSLADTAMAASSGSAFLKAFRSLRICAAPNPLRQTRAPIPSPTATLAASRQSQNVRAFSTTPPAFGTWLEPSLDRKRKKAKGRPRVPTGGSTKGTTVIWGDYGLRMTDHHRRISAKQLKVAEDTIKIRLRGEKYRLYKRKCCNIGVYVSGNEVSSLRMKPRWACGARAD